MLESPVTRLRLLFAALLGLVVLSIFAFLIYKGKISARFSKQLPPPVIVSTGTVAAGDIMTSILSNHGLAPDVVTKIQLEIGKSFNLRHMKPGHNFEVVTSTTGVFQKFIYHDDITHFYTVSRSSMNVYTSTDTTIQTIWKEKLVTCEIHEFLLKDLMKLGYDANFSNLFANYIGDYIFPWQIDFFTEQRPGDSLRVLLEQETMAEGDKPLNRLRILAASYIGKGTRRKDNYAISYQIPGTTKVDFFDLDGKAIRKAFLRAPFTFANFHISSGFSNSRFHPILRIYRPHHGIDYAAPFGTRASCVGKGTVVFAGWKSGYGKCVEVRHNAVYTSRYGHFSKIGVSVGQSINQGQYVGNVGNTGLSTGPHLHFEMLVNGVSKNFVKLDFPSASSVPTQNISDFNQVRDALLARLNPNASVVSSASPAASPSGSKSSLPQVSRQTPTSSSTN